MSLSLEQMAAQITEWCTRHGVVPANGQVAADTTVRTLRYYRTMGLLDAALEGGGSGYEKHHFLQAAAVRVLQAQGLPLSRIQSLLFARTDEELQAILDSATGADAAGLAVLDQPSAAASVSAAQAQSPETWQTWPVTPEVMLVSRRPGQVLTAAQIEAIRRILQDC